MEQVHHQWIVEEEEEEYELQEATALEGRKSLQHRKDSIIVNGLVPFSSSSSSSPTSNGRGNGISSASVDELLIQQQEEPPSQKEEELLILKEQEETPPTQKEEEPHIQKEEEEVEEIGIVIESGNHLNDDNAAVGLGLVAEFVGDATNGEALNTTNAVINAAALQNNNSVFFDSQQGDEVNGLKGVQNAEGARSVLPKSHGEENFSIQVENSDIQNSLCNEVNSQCMKTADDKVPFSSELSPLQNSSEVQATTVENFGDDGNAKAGPNLIKEIDQQLKELDVEAVLAKQETHDLFCPNCKSCITKRVILRKRKRNIHKFDTETTPDESDTKRINSSVIEANQGGHAIATSEVGSLEPSADNYEPEREPEVFRCLSCFSFFIPLRNGIKLFPNFGGAREPETSQNPLIIPESNLENPSNAAASNANWFIFPFTKKGRKAIEQGDASVENSRAGPAEQDHSSSITTSMLTSPRNGNPKGPLADTAISKNVKLAPDIKPEPGWVNSPIPSSVKSVTIEPGIENDINSSVASGNKPLADLKCLRIDLSSMQSCTQSASDVMNGLQKVRTDFIDFSAKEQPLTETVKTDVGEKKNDSVDMIKTDKSSTSFSDDMVSKTESALLANAATTEIHFNDGKSAGDAIMKSYEGSLILKASQKDVDKTPEIAQNTHSSLTQESQSPAQLFGSALVPNDIGSDKQGSGVDATIPSDQDFKKVQTDIEEAINPSVRKENKVFAEAEAFKSLTPQTADNVPVERATVTEAHTQIYVGEQPRAEIGEPQEWEMLKSVVYGGLVESITSLGIVSSAAGSGAAPLNIIAMGLANLIGGLFIIFHNLIELKNDNSGGDLQQMSMQEDRYQELLGRRANFLLHAVVAVSSFLIFGSVPIVIYGLLISKNYYPEVKLAAVATISIACIILLAVGKVHTTRPPKTYIKTVLQYVTLALAASGVSYIAGELFNHLLEKFSGSESGFVLSMPSSGTRSMKPAWMSY